MVIEYAKCTESWMWESLKGRCTSHGLNIILGIGMTTTKNFCSNAISEEMPHKEFSAIAYAVSWIKVQQQHNNAPNL